jgi:hypothetical protein
MGAALSDYMRENAAKAEPGSGFEFELITPKLSFGKPKQSTEISFKLPQSQDFS